jgi:hypothetical protein
MCLSASGIYQVSVQTQEEYAANSSIIAVQPV